MTDPDHPRHIIQTLISFPAAYDRAAGNLAIDVLGNIAPADRERIHAFLLAYALQYRIVRLGEVARPGGREIIDALNIIAKAAGQIDRAMTVLRRARQTANEGCGDAEDCRWALFPFVVDAFQRAMRVQQTDWVGGYEDPLTGAFGSIADEITGLANRFDVADVRDATRTQHPGLTELIGLLAGLYSEWTGKAASAQQPGDRPDYRSPFVRFVHAFAPLAGIDPELSAKTIARALALYSRLPRNFEEIRRTDGDPIPCHSSSDSHEQTRNHDHEI